MRRRGRPAARFFVSLDFHAKIGYVSRAIGRCFSALVDFSLVVLVMFFTLGYLLLYLAGSFMPPNGPIAVGEETSAVVYLLLNYVTPGPRAAHAPPAAPPGPATAISCRLSNRPTNRPPSRCSSLAVAEIWPAARGSRGASACALAAAAATHPPRSLHAGGALRSGNRYCRC